MERMEPGAAHAALAVDLHATMERYAMMPAVERVACLAQILGHVLADVPEVYPSQAVMAAVSRNIEMGNRQATSGAGSLAVLDGPHGAA